MERVGLTLVAGPANAGKVALLLERYLAALPHGPLLIVPNRSDVERVERQLLCRQPCLLGGWIGTFDDLFARLAPEGPLDAIGEPSVSPVENCREQIRDQLDHVRRHSVLPRRRSVF